VKLRADLGAGDNGIELSVVYLQLDNQGVFELLTICRFKALSGLCL
jgi:hypothetical protein